MRAVGTIKITKARHAVGLGLMHWGNEFSREKNFFAKLIGLNSIKKRKKNIALNDFDLAKNKNSKK